jgi:hypothetical protein
MLKISSPPPVPLNEEWKELTAPVEVPVVDTANKDEAHSPSRDSLPSMAPPAAWSATPGWFTSSAVTAITRATQIRVIVAIRA